MLLGLFSLHGEQDTMHSEGIVLAVHSYHWGYSWTSQHIVGLNDAFDTEEQRNRFYHEFMDYKRLDKGDDYQAFLDYICDKYKGLNIVALVATDDHALNCAETLRRRLDLDMPIFYSGITALDEFFVPEIENATGILERLDLNKTLQFALSSFPDLEKVYFLAEDSLSGSLIVKGIENQLDLPDGVALMRLEAGSLEEQVERVKLLSENSIIIVTNYRRDAEGRILDQAVATQMLAENSAVPLFVSYPFSICKDMVGGCLLDSYHFGVVLGRQLKRYLSGVPIDEIEVVRDSPSKWVFSEYGIEKYGLDKSVIPAEAHLCFEKEKSMLRFFVIGAAVVVLILVQVFFILVLFVSRGRLKKLATELQESRRNLSAWIIHAPIPVSIFTKVGEAYAINNQYTELLGYDISDFRNADQMWSVLIQDEFVRLQFMSEWKKYYEQEDDLIKPVLPQEISLISKSGDPKVLEVHVSMIGDYLVCFYNDVTWRSQIEIELENALNEAFNASKAKTQFLTNMSHEIRTPMNGVLGMAQLLADTSIDAEQKLYLETIQKSGEMLLLTINDILDLSKIESGQLGLEEAPYDLRSCLENSISICLPKLDSEHVKFLSVIDSGIPQELMGDTYRVSQIIVNLLTNAFKYTKEGAVELSARIVELTEEDVRICVSVRDSGIGISDQKKRLIFEPFSQADASNTRQYGGTGLGLTICKELANMMSGEVTVESEEGVGSTFIFTWSAKISKKSEAKNPNGQDLALSEKEVVSYDVETLVVEDNNVNYKVIELSLIKMGIRPDRACNGVEAVEMVRSKEYELIFMDIQMPEMDGLTATGKIRSEVCDDRQPFIIALTAHALEDHIEQCRKVKMNGFLSKPFNNSDLQRGIELYLQEKASDRFVAYF